MVPSSHEASNTSGIGETLTGVCLLRRIDQSANDVKVKREPTARAALTRVAPKCRLDPTVRAEVRSNLGCRRSLIRTLSGLLVRPHKPWFAGQSDICHERCLVPPMGVKGPSVPTLGLGMSPSAEMLSWSNCERDAELCALVKGLRTDQLPSPASSSAAFERQRFREWAQWQDRGSGRRREIGEIAGPQCLNHARDDLATAASVEKSVGATHPPASVAASASDASVAARRMELLRRSEAHRLVRTTQEAGHLLHKR